MICLDKSLGIVSILVFSSINTFCQHGRFSISGKVKFNARPLQGATVELFSRDSVVVRITLTSREGAFSLTDVEKGEYMLVISNAALKTYQSGILLDSVYSLDVGEITLDKNDKMLGEAVVIAKQPFITYANDKILFHIDEKLQKASQNAYDLLGKAPEVTIGPHDKVQVLGQSNILVTVNGKMRFASVHDAVDFLKITPAGDIERIEIIEHPSSRYGATESGGIINIVLKKDETQGLQGNASGYFNAGHYSRYGGALNLNFAHKNLKLFGDYSYGREVTYKTSSSEDRVDNTGTTYYLLQDYREVQTPDRNSTDAGFDYQLNKNSVISGLATVKIDRVSGDGATNTTYRSQPMHIDSVFRLRTDDRKDHRKYFYNLNYNGRIDTAANATINADLNFLRDVFTSRGQFALSYLDSQNVRLRPDYDLIQSIPTTLNVSELRVDYARDLRPRMKLEAGVKVDYSMSDNDTRYDSLSGDKLVADSSLSSHYKYSELVDAAYVNIRKSGARYNLQAGLRYEWAIVTGNSIDAPVQTRHFNALFPEISGSYKLDRVNRLKASFREVVARPDFAKLNPYIQYVNQNLYLQGNPNLKQYTTYIMSVGYVYKNSYSATLRYDHAKNFIPQTLFSRVDSSLVTRVTYENAADLDGLQFSVYIPVRVTDWWNMYNNLSAFYISINPTNRKDSSLEAHSYNGSINMSNVFELPRGFHAELDLSIETDSRNNQITYRGSHELDLRVTRSFLHDDLKVAISFMDITNHDYNKGYLHYDGIYNSFFERNDTRRIGCSVSYVFGRKKVTERRQRDTGIEDVDNRINTRN